MSLQGHPTLSLKTLDSWGRILVAAMKSVSVTPVFRRGKKENPGKDGLIILTSVPVKSFGADAPRNHVQGHEGTQKTRM